MQSLPRAPFISLFALLSLPSVLLAQSEEITFHKDIEPILQANCQGCHRPGGAGPMPMLTYEQVAPFAGLIEYKTGLRDQAGAMPPWYIEKDIGIQDYKDDMSLSEEEILTISAWARSGSLQGDPADAPDLLEWDDSVKWTLGEPDLIVVMPEVSMKADAPDWWGTLPAVPTGLTEDRYVKSLEMVEVNDLDMSQVVGTVGGRWIIHHMQWEAGVIDEGGSENISALPIAWPLHEVGRNPDTFDPRAGPLLQANTVIYPTTLHLHSTGKDTTGHLEFGFRFHEKGYEPEYNERLSAFGDSRDISIIPNQDGQILHAYEYLSRHTKIVRFEPHLHGHGKRMCLEAIFGGDIETLSCAGYDHNWVRSYVYEDHAAPLLPAGTILHLYGENDNSTNNINVIDPRNWAGSGNRSAANMFVDIGSRVYLTDDQFHQAMADRREALNMGPNDYAVGCPLCTAPLVVPINEEGTNSWRTLARVLYEINQSPNDEQKAELMTIVEDPNSDRIETVLARVIATIDGTVTVQNAERLVAITGEPSRWQNEAVVMANALIEFNGTASEDFKDQLLEMACPNGLGRRNALDTGFCTG